MGTDQEGSDLDLLVDAPPGTTLFDLGGLQVELEDLLGVNVDLLTPGDLPLKFRDKVLAGPGQYDGKSARGLSGKLPLTRSLL